MHISKARIKNFRLLADVEMRFEEATTVVLGRNNSGKTSLAELFKRFGSGSAPSFGLEDFSLVAHEKFWDAYQLQRTGAEAGEVRALLPEIELSVIANYSLKDPDLGLLGDFVVDLDPACTRIQIDVTYKMGDGKLQEFFPETLDEGDGAQIKEALFRHIRDRVRSHYSTYAEAVDPNDETNRKVMDISTVRRLIRCDFVNAQRTLDDSTLQESNVLGKIVEAMFSAASGSTRDADKARAEALRLAVSEVEESMKTGFSSQLDDLLPAFDVFGYPGLPDPSLATETILNVEALLQNHTKVKYAGLHGVNLPEGHNGLGTRNLIYILLKLLEYFKSYDGSASAAGMHLVFLEEPEAHLHPQMQEVFIGQLDKIAKVFSDLYAEGKAWPVQFVVSTHSPHMANKAPFRAMRYFLASPVAGMGRICSTTIKDLRKGFEDIPEDEEEFLHQYMTLTRCDLLFADKAILVEGTSERLLMPVMIEKHDAAAGAEPTLGSQYISVIEVDGAYAHYFFDLLKFLELRALVVTDLDSISGPTRSACMVSEGTATSNECIKSWFDSKTIDPGLLLSMEDAKKLDGNIRIAYQVPETAGKPCGRSLEGAFMLANPTLFKGASGSGLTESEAWVQAGAVKKSNFALTHALREKGWQSPRYIKEGLAWLAEKAPCDAVPPSAPITAVSQGGANA